MVIFGGNQANVLSVLQKQTPFKLFSDKKSVFS